MKSDMKTLIASLFISVTFSAAATASSATLVNPPQLSLTSLGGASTMETKGRTGSKRVGGYTKNGKGSKYVGGWK